ncbi:MAG: 3-oxoacyl-ACP synthase [Nitrospira sp. WS110]|nr:3-oxoacyl-ACP synthase [Nitrospira sp. WS110]
MEKSGRSDLDSSARGSSLLLLPSASRTSFELSQPERQTHVKKPTTKKRSRTNWSRIDALKDKEIDTSDIPEQTRAFFKRAVLRLPEPKTTVTIRLDRQVLNWFKSKGPGYQTRINALLRAYMEAHKR